MNKVIFTICMIASFSAMAESPVALLIQSIRCGSGTPNVELIQKNIGSVGGLTSEAAIKMLVTDSDGNMKQGAGAIESSSKLAVVIPVSGKADSFCIAESSTYMNVNLKK